MTEQAGNGNSRVMSALEKLMGMSGVLAGMVATDEGLPLAARLRSGLDEEGIAAAAAVLGQLGSKAASQMGARSLDLIVLDTSRLRFMVQPLTVGYLMVVTELLADADPVAAEMTSAVAHLNTATAALTEPRAA